MRANKPHPANPAIAPRFQTHCHGRGANDAERQPKRNVSSSLKILPRLRCCFTSCVTGAASVNRAVPVAADVREFSRHLLHKPADLLPIFCVNLGIIPKNAGEFDFWAPGAALILKIARPLRTS